MKTITINSDNPDKGYKIKLAIQSSDQISAQILDCISNLTNLLYQEQEAGCYDQNDWLTETLKDSFKTKDNVMHSFLYDAESYLTKYAKPLFNDLSPADVEVFRILRDNQDNSVFREAMRQAEEARRTGLLELGRKKDGYDAR